MARFLHRKSVYSACSHNALVLAFFWLSGILAGIWIYFVSGDSFASLMRSCLYGSVSIVRLLFVVFLPFLLSASAVYLSGHKLIFPIALCKGFSFSCVTLGILQCFGCAGWMIRLFLCFSDLISLPLLYWYWLRCLQKEDSSPDAANALLFSLLFLIGCIDYCLVSPFLADLLII